LTRPPGESTGLEGRVERRIEGGNIEGGNEVAVGLHPQDLCHIAATRPLAAATPAIRVPAPWKLT